MVSKYGKRKRDKKIKEKTINDINKLIQCHFVVLNLWML